jgi:small subunit ribosomal protein S21
LNKKKEYICIPEFYKIIRDKMIIVPVKDGESIEKSLKKFKKKIEKTGLVKELRARQKFTKPSVVKREAKIKAVYVQKLRHDEQA